MRDKYIELIKEYIKEKPEYRQTLNELKADVLTVGATEEEFNEAVKELTGLPNSSELFLEKEPQEYIFGNTDQNEEKPVFSNRYEALGNFADFAKTHLRKRRSYVAIIALFLIMFFVITQIGKNNNSQKTAALNKPSIKIPISEGGAIPVVYANLKPVDPEKIFSIKSSDKIQLTITGKPKKEVLGFFPYWMLPKEDVVNLSSLTSITLFGLEVDGNGNMVTSGSDNQATGGWSMWNDPKIDAFIRRAKNQNIKVYLTLKSFDNGNIELLGKNDTSQKNLIANALYLVNSKNLDGINIDFEYLGDPGEQVRNGFTRLVTNLNSELKRQMSKATLTIDTYLVSGSEKDLFNIPLLAKASDAFVIMGYDMHTPLNGPGPVSAMGGETNIIGYVQNYLEQVDASKLILAVPYYGYDWPKDIASPSADMVKILPFAQIADASRNLQLLWDDTSQTPYFTYKDDNGQERIVHFDNVRSLAVKYDFIVRKNLKGVGIWALGYDGQNQDLEKLLIDKFINQ